MARHIASNLKEPIITIQDLPKTFIVRYLGNHPSKGLWGIKHTRKPVDFLVNQAKLLPADSILPIVKFEVNLNGIHFVDMTNKKVKSEPVFFGVDIISYGVQDLIYTRVFSMIIVTESNETELTESPFVCHSFACDSRNQARQITYALAAVFQEFGKRVKEESIATGKPIKRFAIDLRPPDQKNNSSEEETEA